MADKYVYEANKEYSLEFDEKRKKAMWMSFYKYGPLAINYGQNLVSAIGNIELCLANYHKTGNTENLINLANYAMVEYMYPSLPNAHYRATDSHESAGYAGMSVREMDEKYNPNER